MFCCPVNEKDVKSNSSKRKSKTKPKSLECKNQNGSCKNLNNSNVVNEPPPNKTTSDELIKQECLNYNQNDSNNINNKPDNNNPSETSHDYNFFSEDVNNFLYIDNEESECDYKLEADKSIELNQNSALAEPTAATSLDSAKKDENLKETCTTQNETDAKEERTSRKSFFKSNFFKSRKTKAKTGSKHELEPLNSQKETRQNMLDRILDEALEDDDYDEEEGREEESPVTDADTNTNTDATSTIQNSLHSEKLYSAVKKTSTSNKLKRIFSIRTSKKSFPSAKNRANDHNGKMLNGDLDENNNAIATNDANSSHDETVYRV